MRTKILVLFLFFSISLKAQDGALPMMRFQQSTFLHGAGQIGTALPNDDVLGFYFNPAMLGYSSRINHASFSIMPEKTDWIWDMGMKYHNFGMNLGLNLQQNFDLPVSIGFGYLNHTFNYGEVGISTPTNPNPISYGESYDKFTAYSFGIGLNTLVKINFGITIKSFTSKLGPFVDAEGVRFPSAEGTAYDLGALLIFPINELLFSDLKFPIGKDNLLLPKINFSIGNSISNIGDEIYYIDEAQKDPLSRNSRLGYTFNFGFDLENSKTKFNFIDYNFSVDAFDGLLETNEFYETSYQNINSDINIIDHLVLLNPDDKIIIHKGHIFSFFDSFIFSIGSFQGSGYSSSKSTSGFGYTSKGILNLLSSEFDNHTIQCIAKHFEIEYYDSSVKLFRNEIVNFKNINFHFKNFEL